MPAARLTPRQHDVVDLIVRLGRPRVRDLGRALGITSTGAVRQRLGRLRALGLVTWEPQYARTVRVIGPYAVDPAGHVTPLDAVPVAARRTV